MEIRKLGLILKASLDPNHRKDAEEQLNQIRKIIGFAPALLQVVMSDEFETAVRQAGAVYLKNTINDFWAEQEADPSEPVPFSIHEQDRGLIRESIVEAVIHAPDILRLQLVVCVSTIIKKDFPGRWTQVVDKISIYMQNPDPNIVYGALLCLYQLVKSFEYKKGDQRGPLNEAMHLLLPMMYTLMVKILPDPSEKSVTMQKLILKIYHSLIQFTLSLDLVTKEVFQQWMVIIRQVVDRPVPEETNAVDEDDRPELPWWKCKKWAVHILDRVFLRYGSPNMVMKEYKAFAKWYLSTFSAGIIEVLLKQLDRKRRNEYIAPRVLQDTIEYLRQGISHSHTWAFLKPHVVPIIREIVFPILCHTEEDEELWNTDPQEYIQCKFNAYEDEVMSNTYSAQNFLRTACQKRKQILPETLQFILSVIQTPNIEPNKKDGALNMVGTIGEILCKKEAYKKEVGKMIRVYVFPECDSSHGFLRARAFWVINRFMECIPAEEQLKLEAGERVLKCLLSEEEIRVKVEASLCVASLILHQQPEILDFMKPEVKKIAMKILEIIKETKQDEITNVLQKMICQFPEEMSELAEAVCQYLAETFSKVMDESDNGSDDNYSIMTMSILNSLETFVSAMEEKPQVVAKVRPIILQVAVYVLSHNIAEFYEESLSLIYELTTKEISPDLWKTLEIIYEVFQKDGMDYFVDMMPALHNYVTVDTDAFLSNENYLIAIFNMCKTVLTSDMGEDPESHAAKLLEVIILQCKGRIDQCIPIFVDLVLRRLLRGIKTSELRIMCLQVVIAALYYNPQLLLEILNKLQHSLSPTESIVSHFIRQWIHDADCFLGLHDRKICVLGLCTLLMLPDKPPALNEYAPRIIPSLLLLFQGLRRAYAARAQENTDDSDSDEDDDEFHNEVDSLASDEDEDEDIDDLESLEQKINDSAHNSPFPISTALKAGHSDDDSEDSDDSDPDYDPQEETPLECFTTPLDDDEDENPDVLDEYVYFKDVMIALQERDPEFYGALTACLNSEQQKELQEVFMLANQRKAAAESKKIEQSGGYMFVQRAVPTSFKFGSNSGGFGR